MTMWIAILVTVFVSLILGIIYLVHSIGEFDKLKSIDEKWKRRLISFAIILAASVISYLLLGLVNTIIILLHVILLFLFYGLIFRIIQAIRKKEFKINWQGWFALITAVLLLGSGYYLCHNVWQTDYNIATSKKIEPLKVALFADSHLSTTFEGDGFTKHIETIKKQSPDMVVISGDFVDDDSKKKDLVKACEALGSMNPKYGVWFAYGNHDAGFFKSRDFTAKELEDELKKNNVGVLKDDYQYVGDVCIVGRLDGSVNRDRKELSEILKDVDKSKYIVVLDHEPTDYEKEEKTSADIVLSGHTHGGQFFPINDVGRWTGASDLVYGHEKRNNTDFIVTSGISDWALDFKTGTKSEYVIVNVKSK